MSKRPHAHPRQGQSPPSGLNSPPKRIVKATVVKGGESYEIDGGVYQFQILPNGQAMALFEDGNGCEFTFAFADDTIIKLDPARLDVAQPVVDPPVVMPK